MYFDVYHLCDCYFYITYGIVMFTWFCRSFEEFVTLVCFRLLGLFASIVDWPRPNLVTQSQNMRARKNFYAIQ